jgi:hypothetical protein
MLDAIAPRLEESFKTCQPCLLNPRDFNAVIQELAGSSALRGPAGPGGAPLRFGFDRFEMTAAEFAEWAAHVGRESGYQVAVFGLGRAAGDAKSKAAAAAATAAVDARRAVDSGLAGTAGTDAGESEPGAAGAGAAAVTADGVTAEVLRASAPAGVPGGQEPLHGVEFAQHAAIWVRCAGSAVAETGGDEGAQAPGGGGAAGGKAPLRRFWGPLQVAALLPGDLERMQGGVADSAMPDVLEQI